MWIASDLDPWIDAVAGAVALCNDVLKRFAISLCGRSSSVLKPRGWPVLW
jgi:hypothetical protein